MDLPAGYEEQGPRRLPRKKMSTPVRIIQEERHLPRKRSSNVKPCKEDLRKVFDIYDSNHDGFITLADLDRAFQGFNLILSASERANATVNDQVNFDSFRHVFTLRMTARLSRDIKEALRLREVDENYKLDLGDCSSEEIRTIFRVFDQDGDGFISTAELRHVTSMVGEPMTTEELDAMVAEADLDKDGRISFEEFGLMLIRQNHGH